MAKGPLLTPAGFAILRAPVLPASEAVQPEQHGRGIDDALFRAALRVASPGLAARLNAVSAKEAAPDLRRKANWYQRRMALRPTPFGLFAGVTTVEFAAATSVSIKAIRASARPDMAWLFDLVHACEADPRIKPLLTVTPNPTIRLCGHRLLIDQPPRGPTDKARSPTAIRNSAAVATALELARQAPTIAELAARIADTFPKNTSGGAERLLDQLLRLGFLLTSLWPPLTTTAPLSWVAEHLPRDRRADEYRSTISAAQQSATAHQQELNGLLDGRPVHGESDSKIPVQVDTALVCSGTLHRRIGVDAVSAAKILLKISALPNGPTWLTHYYHAFLDRFGLNRLVPLHDLLDPDTGLGPPRRYATRGPSDYRERRKLRNDTLLRLACTALHEHLSTIELDQASIARLSLKDTVTPPSSLEIYLRILATSRDAIDTGDYLLAVGPLVGAVPAGRSLARFAYMLNDGEERLRSLSTSNADKATIHCELVHYPTRRRAANVMLRPAIQRWELPIDATPAVGADRVVPLGELVVSARHGRLQVIWPARASEVIVNANHLVNLRTAPPICQFLVEASREACAQLTGFDWGPASGFPRLPRVTAGRLVLRPAQWRLDSEADPNKQLRPDLNSIAAWRESHDVPRWVHLGEGDHQLLLDLDNDSDAEELRRNAQNSNETAVIKEALPSPDNAWLPGPRGLHINEIVVPLIGAPVSRNPRPIVIPAAADASRIRPPGSDWLFLKLYVAPELEEDILLTEVAPLATKAIQDGLADRWFYSRYADPERHLRVRWKGAPHVLTHDLFPTVSNWAAQLIERGVVKRLAFDTYERELERFGGKDRLDTVERLFAADSSAVLELLEAEQHGPPLDRTVVGVASVDAFLAGLRLEAPMRTRWARHFAPKDVEAGRIFRSQKALLATVISPNRSAVLGRHRANAISQLEAAIHDVTAGQSEHGAWSEDQLIRSLVHMHCNRLLPSTNQHEGRILALLHRAAAARTHLHSS